MKISVITNNSERVITKGAKIATSSQDRLLGLINPQNPRFLVFHTHFGLHTFFLKKPVDMILLNQSKEIVKIHPGLSPFRFFLYNPMYSIVIEMPEGTINKYHLRINDKISIE